MAERSHTHVYSRSALTVWRAVPLCCNAMLAQRMRAQRASHTAARAEYHTLACPRSSARPSNHHIWSDIGLATQTTKTVVRGARGTCLQTTCEGRFQCVLGTTHRDRHHATGVVALARVSSPSRRNYEITASSYKSKSRQVTPLFYGCHLNFMVGHASPLEDSPQIGIWIVQQDAAIHGQKASFIRIAW